MAEVVVPEALCDNGANPQDLGHALTTDHHVPVVELHVHVRLLVQQIISAPCWG